MHRGQEEVHPEDDWRVAVGGQRRFAFLSAMKINGKKAESRNWTIRVQRSEVCGAAH